MNKISLPALLMLSSSSLASADIPTELRGNWHPCWGNFGNHTVDVNEQWQIGAIDFVVAKLPGSNSEFFLDVRGAQADSLRDVTWHIVEGDDGAMKLPKLDPQDFCKDGSPVLDPTPGDYTYMIGVADLSSKSDDGQYCGPTPHIVMFEPLEVGPQKQKYFALTVTHLGDKCATGAHHKAPADTKAARPPAFGPAKAMIMHNGVVHGHP